MTKPRVIVCERSGKWATAVARELPADARLVQTRGLDECASELARAPASLVALELTAKGLAGVVAVLSEWHDHFPRARTVILADHELRGCEALVREAGAIHFFESPRGLAGLGAMAAKHLARAGETKLSFAETVWENLPWSEVANT